MHYDFQQVHSGREYQELQTILVRYYHMLICCSAKIVEILFLPQMDDAKLGFSIHTQLYNLVNHSF